MHEDTRSAPGRSSGAFTPMPALRLAVRVLGGSRNGFVQRLAPDDVAGGVVLGHGPDCGLRFDQRRDVGVAKYHAILVQRGAALLVQDLAGRGDVLADGQGVAAGGTFLREGSRIQLGQRGPIVVVESDRVGGGSPGVPPMPVAPPARPEPADPGVLVPGPAMFARVAPLEGAVNPGRGARRLLAALLVLSAGGMGLQRLDADAEQAVQQGREQARVVRLQTRLEGALRRARGALAEAREGLGRSREELARTTSELWPADGPPVDDPPSRRIAAARRAVANAARTVGSALDRQKPID